MYAPILPVLHAAAQLQLKGPTRKKSIKLLRKKMWRNAWLLLMLSQGTPLIHAGDEFGQRKARTAAGP